MNPRLVQFFAFGLIVATAATATGEIEIVAAYAASPEWELIEIVGNGLFKNGDGNSSLRVLKPQLGHVAQLELAPEDATTPQFVASVTVRGDNWLDLDFLGDGEGGFFNPYGLPFNENWTSSRHILPPNERPYVFSVMLLDNECNFNFRPCSEAKSNFLSYRATEIQPPLFGDANLDGSVGFDDFLRLSAHFGKDIFLEPAPGWFTGDFDLDGVPDMDDFLALSANFGRSKEAPALSTVPEPSASANWLVYLTLFLLQRRMRRSPRTE